MSLAAEQTASGSGEAAQGRAGTPTDGAANVPRNAVSGDGHAPSQAYGNTASPALAALEQRAPQRYLSPRASFT
ncbi:hypothetical protein BTH42_31040 [Burkholderia sp. SRS-W-2-2016]|nr:hypothetical protein BTH42_31040 [Burkholderia sp. SRS-W-2-2016]